ncbi:unnamed protein product [Effrenium voratum]|nr:unnamed protein product [Effrenium voratum]
MSSTTSSPFRNLILKLDVSFAGVLGTPCVLPAWSSRSALPSAGHPPVMRRIGASQPTARDVFSPFGLQRSGCRPKDWDAANKLGLWRYCLAQIVLPWLCGNAWHDHESV